MKITKIGMRTIKTVLAVIITLAVAELAQLKSPLLASIAAIMTMETSISESFKTGSNRIYGTILGGLTALIIILVTPGNFLFLGLGLIIIINTCNMFKWDKAVRISMVVFLSIVLNYSVGDGFSYALHRTLDTLIGVVIGMATNYLIRPPRLDQRIKKTSEEMIKRIKIILEKKIWKHEYDDLEALKSEIVTIKKDYKTLVEDLKYNVGKTKTTSIYKKIFNLFENLHNHMSVINSIKEVPHINEKNKKVIEDYYGKPIPGQDDIEGDSLDMIYNYHLEKLLEDLMTINSLVYKIHRSSDGS